MCGEIRVSVFTKVSSGSVNVGTLGFSSVSPYVLLQYYVVFSWPFMSVLLMYCILANRDV